MLNPGLVMMGLWFNILKSVHWSLPPFPQRIQSQRIQFPQYAIRLHVKMWIIMDEPYSRQSNGYV